MNKRVIERDGKKLAIHISADEWDRGLSFFSENGDYQQVGTWSYDRGQMLRAHIHNNVKREILRTQEVLFVKQGRLKAKIYSEKEEFITELEVKKGDILICLGGGHGYEILEDNTQVLEVKNGPYPGAEIDRRRIDV